MAGFLTWLAFDQYGTVVGHYLHHTRFLGSVQDCLHAVSPCPALLIVRGFATWRTCLRLDGHILTHSLSGIALPCALLPLCCVAVLSATSIQVFHQGCYSCLCKSCVDEVLIRVTKDKLVLGFG